MSKAATVRLKKEYKKLLEQPVPLIVAKPAESNILEWHYVITGPQDTPYADGQYHGTVVFPREYPFQPPTIRMITPSGRFVPGQRICLSMSDFHPESWNPAWNVSTILKALQSFMVDDEPATGCLVKQDDQVIMSFAKQSRHWNATSNQQFKAQFPELML